MAFFVLALLGLPILRMGPRFVRASLGLPALWAGSRSRNLCACPVKCEAYFTGVNPPSADKSAGFLACLCWARRQVRRTRCTP